MKKARIVFLIILPLLLISCKKKEKEPVEADSATSVQVDANNLRFALPIVMKFIN